MLVRAKELYIYVKGHNEKLHALRMQEKIQSGPLLLQAKLTLLRKKKLFRSVKAMCL